MRSILKLLVIRIPDKRIYILLIFDHIYPSTCQELNNCVNGGVTIRGIIRVKINEEQSAQCGTNDFYKNGNFYRNEQWNNY